MLQHLEDRLAQKPAITVPTGTIDGATDPLKPGGTEDLAGLFMGKHEHRVVAAGHNVPQEKPEQFAEAIVKVQGWL